MKEQKYKQHIKGIFLDKLQEGDFDYSQEVQQGTLSEFAKKLRASVNEMARRDSIKLSGGSN